MRVLSLALFLLVAGLCFIAGYKVGQNSQQPLPVAADSNDEAPVIAELTDSSHQMPVAAPPSPTPAQLPAADQNTNPLELRAQEKVQTFFDSSGRKLIAEILEVQADSLKVRRQADGQELNLPVSMLSADDQAFAAYLWKEQGSITPAPTSSSSFGSMEDKIWEELFN